MKVLFEIKLKIINRTIINIKLVKNNCLIRLEPHNFFIFIVSTC